MTREGGRGALRAFGGVLHSFLRILGALFVAAVLLGSGLGWYAYRRFSPEDARRMAADQLTAMLNRRVTIDRLVLSPRGLKVLGLRVRRRRPVQGEPDLLSCASALVTIKFRPLLQRRLEFDTVILQSPRVDLEREADGTWDLADVFGSSTTASGRGGGAIPLALAAAETMVRDGTLLVGDPRQGWSVSFDGVSMRLDSFNERAPFPVKAAFKVTDRFGGRQLAADVSADWTVDLAGLHWSSATVRAEDLRASIAGAALRGRGAITGFSPLRFTLDLDAPTLSPEQWRYFAGRGLPLTLPPSRWHLEAGLPAPGMFDIEKLTLDTPAGQGRMTGLFDFVSDTQTLSLELAADDADLAEVGRWWPALAKRSLSGRADLRMAITGWPGRLQARDADLTLRDFGASWGRGRIKGALARATATDEFSRVEATVAGATVAALGSEFDAVSLSAALTEKELAVNRLGLRWNGSKVVVSAKVKMRREKDRRTRLTDVVFSGSADKVDWEAAAKLVAAFRAEISTRAAAPDEEASARPWVRTFKYSIPHGFPDTAGHIHVGEVTQANFWCKDVDMLWTLRGVTPALDKASGEARLRFGPGRVSDIPAVQASNQFLSVVFLPFVFMQKMNNLSVFSAGTAYPKTLDFAVVEGEYGAAKGVATTRYFHVASPQLAAYAEGTADFSHEKVDMNILTRLTSYRGTLPEWWVDELGRPAIGFRVVGDLSRPELQPRFKKIGADEIETKVAEGRARAAKRFRALERLLARLEAR